MADDSMRKQGQGSQPSTQVPGRNLQEDQAAGSRIGESGLDESQWGGEGGPGSQQGDQPGGWQSGHQGGRGGAMGGGTEIEEVE